MEESEQPLEKIKGYRADKGEEYTLNSMTVETNLMGTLVLRRKIITRKWNWFWGGYDTKIKLADKLKPKTDDGEKLFYFAHTEQDELESVLVIAGAKGPVAKDGLRQYKEIHVMRFDSEMNRISDQTIQFDQPQYIVGISTADNDEDANAEDDILMLFAPMGGKGMKTVADPDSKNYTYVRISYDGKIKERISIKSKAGIFNGNMFVQSGSDVLILGATGADDDYFNEKFSTPQPTSEMRDAQSDEFKAKGINVNFIEPYNDGIKIRTYERGVEAETLSCGTGATAAALSVAADTSLPQIIHVHTMGGLLQIKFVKKGESQFSDIWLCGPAKHVFNGIIHLP
jgi:hypothetical protein